MPKITLERPHPWSLAQAQRLAEATAERLQRQFGLQYNWDGDVIRFSRPGVDGQLRVDARSLYAEVRLGLMLGAFRKHIEKELNLAVDQLLGQHRPA